MSFPQLRAETLKEHALHVIRDAIMNGNLKPGERLVESKLAEEMGISRGPIREAVSQLKNEGLVKVIPHKGTFVVEWSRDDVLEVYLLRSVLEGLAARKAVELFDHEDFNYLQDLLRQAKTLPPEGTVSQLSGFSLEFHEYICRRCDLPRLYEMWSVVNAQRYLFSFLTFTHASRDEIIQKHQLLLDDLRKRDSDIAEQSMRQHIMDARMSFESIGIKP